MKQRLFTPGPLTTDPRVRAAMDRDWGSRAPDFIALTAELRRRLLDVANAAGTHVAVPLQGSGTFILEAAVATLIGPQHKLLVLVNGAYGRRMVTITERMGRSVAAIEWEEDRPVDPGAVAERLTADPAISHVALVHCETTSGILNPLEAVAEVVADAGRMLIVDAMASFGAVPIDCTAKPIAAVLASSNKCIEGPPGIGFALIERDLFAKAGGRSPSLSFDLHAQWQGFEKDGQWRFTPPVQVVAGTVEALRLLEAEGGPPARLTRYQANLARLRAGIEPLGHRLYLDPAVQGPTIATFVPNPDAPFDFERLYGRLAAKGLLIYPGKLTRERTFRIGCIGHLSPNDFAELIDAFAAA